ncbi:hypothetical protein Droror1_Dr00023012 [Drosera rotundifolia]
MHIAPSTLNQVKQIHAKLITTQSLPPLTSLSTLIQHYFYFSSPKLAHLITHHQSPSSPFLINTLIKCSKPRDSFLVFTNWVSKKEPEMDEYSYIFVLGACARSGTPAALWEGKQVLGRALRNGFGSDLVVATTMVNFYGCCGGVGDARKVFDEMSVRNSAAWNALIKGYCSREMQQIDLGIVRKGYLVFKEMLEDGGREVVPTGTTMVCVLSAASGLGVLEIGASVHGYVEKTLYAAVEDDVYVGTGLVEMYSKCGDLGSALKVFRRMQEKNVLTWTTMITGLAAHGRGSEAMELLDEMKGSGVRPNDVTFTSLISACCGAGLVDECLRVFWAMENEFMIKPDIQHYHCTINLLGHVGRLKEAYDILMRMPVQPEPALLRSFVSACRVQGNRNLGKEVAKFLHRKHHTTSGPVLQTRSATSSL